MKIKIISNNTMPVNIHVDLNLFKFEGNQIYTFLLLVRHFLLEPTSIKVIIQADRIYDAERLIMFVPYVKFKNLADFSIGIDHIEINYMSHLNKT
jgi:hypothetical protein